VWYKKIEIENRDDAKKNLLKRREFFEFLTILETIYGMKKT
tara:strand:- start:322 stop:444 length:123 start_codon:yes stop_codon:yes gene_type:complete